MDNVNVPNATIFNGLSRLTTLKPINGKPAGWVVRETSNPDKEKVYIDLGIWVTEDIFLSVPVDFKMRYLFSLKQVEKDAEGNPTGIKYFDIPASIRFGVKKIFHEKSGKEKIFLVNPDEEYPQSFLTCFAFATNKQILNIAFDDTTKILRKYYDKDTGIVVLIAMSEMPEDPVISLTITSGYHTTDDKHPIKHADCTKFTFDSIGSPISETDTITNEDGFKIQFINFPMLVAPAPKPQNDSEKKPFNKEHKFNGNNKGKFNGNNKQKKFTPKNNNSNAN